jgi:hypothetical protein
MAHSQPPTVRRDATTNATMLTEAQFQSFLHFPFTLNHKRSIIFLPAGVNCVSLLNILFEEAINVRTTLVNVIFAFGAG